MLLQYLRFSKRGFSVSGQTSTNSDVNLYNQMRSIIYTPPKIQYLSFDVQGIKASESYVSDLRMGWIPIRPSA